MSRRDYSKRKGGASLPFTKIDRWIMNTAAWRDLDSVARCLYLELKSRFTGANNGRIPFGSREAAVALNVGKTTAQRAFASLEEHGFVVVAEQSGFDQKRLSREWLLTELKDDRDGSLPRKDFTRWRADPSDCVVPAGIGTSLLRLRGRDAA